MEKNLHLPNQQVSVSSGLTEDDAFVESLKKDVLLSCHPATHTTKDVAEHLGLEICKKIISRFHHDINPKKLSASTSTADLGFDWFDSLQLLAHIEMVLNKDVFPRDMEYEKFSLANVIAIFNQNLK
ncbi:MAG: hypothetical protein IKK52_04110 [Alphaproteobacteria bacterium]|nr:hypothetical protein [Alphaproteobacteria bacterium]